MFCTKPEYEPGGRALGFYSSVMIRLRIGEIKFYKGKKTNGIVIGNDVNFKIHKNKTFRRGQSGTYTVYTDRGGPVPPGHFDNIESAIIDGIAWRVIETKAQGSYEFNGDKIRGKDNLVAYLRDNDEAIEYIKESIMEKLSKNKSNIEIEESGEDE